jgi:REP element-mobilizing transposase RayT
VIRTKYSKRVLPNEHSEELYRYIWGFINNKKCHLYRINGMPDHIHILTSLHPTLSMSAFMKDLKVSTSIWLKKSGKFPDFEAWGEKYAAFSCSFSDKNTRIEYIKNQREHHKTVSFREEYRKLIEEAGIKIDERFFLDDDNSTHTG